VEAAEQLLQLFDAGRAGERGGHAGLGGGPGQGDLGRGGGEFGGGFVDSGQDAGAAALQVRRDAVAADALGEIGGERYLPVR
jgi:hypothetical protein